MVKLKKLDNEGKETDVIGEFDDKVAKELLAMPGSKWKETTDKPSLKADDKK